MNVVLDANVLVSAVVATGAPYRIVTRWLNREEFHIVVCPALLAEVEDVLARPKLRKRVDAGLTQLYLGTIRRIGDVAPDPAGVAASTREPHDDYLVALAREQEAEFIVSGDKDLLEWTEQRPPVITPAAFEDLLGE